MSRALGTLAFVLLVLGAGCKAPEAKVAQPAASTEPAASSAASAEPRILGAPTVVATLQPPTTGSTELVYELNVTPNMREAKLDAQAPLELELEGGTLVAMALSGENVVTVRIRPTGPGRFKVKRLRYAEGSPRNPMALVAQGDFTWKSGSTASTASGSRRRRQRSRGPREITPDDIVRRGEFPDSLPPPVPVRPKGR